MDPDLFLQDVLAGPAARDALLDAYDGPASPLAQLGPDPLGGRRVALMPAATWWRRRIDAGAMP